MKPVATCAVMRSVFAVGRLARPALGAAGLAAALLALPAALAHDAAEPREVDARVLLDDDGLLGFGGCVEGECQPGDPHPGLDLLSLDAREGRLPDGRPVLMLSLGFQWLREGVPDRSIRLQFTAGGQQQVVTVLGADTAAPTVAGAERVLGPHPIGDGHPRSVEAWFLLPTIGLTPGGAMADVSAQSRRGEAIDDVMPGIWYQDGVLMPHVPHSADAGEAVEEQPLGQYGLKGPAPLLVVSSPAPDSVALPRSYAMTVTNPLANLTQAIEATVRFGVGTARLDQSTLVLAPGESRVLNLTTSDVLASGDANVTLSSDLGGWASFGLPIVAPPPATTTPPPAPGKDSPPASAVGLLAALLAALAVRRRQP
jgi:MYXO-CTERM domain-containing protein